MALYNVRATPCQSLCDPLINVTNITLSTDETVTVGSSFWDGRICWSVLDLNGLAVDPIVPEGVYTNCDECFLANNLVANIELCPPNKGIIRSPWLPGYSICQKGVYQYNGVCFSVGEVRQLRDGEEYFTFPEQPTFIDPINCEVCNNSGYTYLYVVTDCVTNYNYTVGSNLSLKDEFVSYFLSTDPLTQRCGFINPGVISTLPVLGGVISVISDCETCLSQTNKKVELINCIDGSVEVAWASTFFNINDITYVDFAIPDRNGVTELKCCYSIGEETESEITLPVILSYDLSETCQKCVECNGVYYLWEDCSAPEVTGFSLSYQYMTINQTFISPDNNGSCKKVIGTFSGLTGNLLAGRLTGNEFTNQSNQLDERVRYFLEQPDGKFIIGGNFTTFGLNPTNRILRVNSDGSYDNTFIGGFDNNPISIDQQSDGKIIVGGPFSNYDNGLIISASTYIARLETDGSLDTSFLPTLNGGGFDDIVQSVEVQSDGKILVGGWFDSYNDGSVNPAYRLIRLNTDGSVDLTFNVGSGFLNITEGDNGRVFKTKTQIDGKIIVVGQFDTYDGLPAKGIIRLNSDGSRDNTFNIGSGFDGNPLDGYGYYLARWINLYSDGRILISGHFESYDGQPANKLIRLNSDGSIDNTFNSLIFGPTWFDDRTIQTEIQSDGKIITGGFFDTYDTESYPKLIRLNSDGSIDDSFYIGSGFNDYVLSLLITSDNKLLVGGQFTNYDSTPQSYITQLTLTPQFDTIFSSPLFNECETCVNSTLTLNAGSVYPSVLNGGIDDIALSLREQPDGKLLIGGWFGDYNGDNVNSLIRLNTDWSLDPTFQNIGLLNDAAYAIDLQSDGKILVGGWFDDYNSQPVVNGFARLNSDGTLDTSFLANTGFTINSQPYANNAIKVLSDDKILVGGGFVNYNNMDYRGVMKFNQDGSVDNTFNVSGTGIYNDFNPSSPFNEQIGYYQGYTACYSKSLDKRFIYFYNETVGVSISGNPFHFSETFSLPTYLQSLQYSVGTNLLVGWNNNKILVIDPVTYNVISTQSYSSISLQRGVTTNSDYVYIFNAASPQTIEVFNILTNTLITSLPIPGLSVSDIVFNSVNNKIYFVCYNDNIYSIDTLTNTLSTTINVGVGGNFQFLTVDTNNNKLYAQNVGAIPRQLFVFDCSTETQITAITLPNTNVGKPVFNENQNLVYVPNGSLIVIDTITDTIIDTQPLLSYDSSQLLFDDNNGLLIRDQSVYDPIVEKDYVSDYLFKGNRGVKNTVNNLYYICKESSLYTGSYPSYPLYIFDPSNNNIISTIDLPERGNFIIYESTLNTVWVTTNNYLLEIDCNTNTIVNSIGGTYYDLVFDNNSIYAVDYTNNYLTEFSYPGYVTTNLSVGVAPIFLTKDNDNNRIYVSNSGSNDVSVVDLSTFTVTNTIPVGNSPRNIIYNYNDQTIYVNNNLDGTFSYIDASTLIVGGTFVGTVGIDMKIDSNGYLITSQSGSYQIYNLITKTQVGSGSIGGSTGGIFIDDNNTIIVFESIIYDQYPFSQGRAYTFNVQSDGSILIGGYFKYYNNTTTSNLVKVLTNGQIDLSFNIGNGFSGGSPLSGAVRNILRQSDGKFICTGHFTSYDGNSVNRIVRLNSDGSIDNTFNIGSGFDDRVLSSVLQSDGKIICIGEFTEYDGTPANRIIRLNIDGSIDTSFVYGDGFDDIARTSLLMSDNTLLVSGYFSNYKNLLGTDYLVRLSLESTESEYTWYEFTPCYGPSGYISLDSTFNPSGENVIIKANYGTVGLVCGVVGDVVFDIPETGEMYTATDYSEFSSCSECNEGIVYGVTIRNCETGELSQYNMTPQSVLDVSFNGPVFKLNASTTCYQLISSCVIPNESETIYPTSTYGNCITCSQPLSAGTEYVECVICCSCEGVPSIKQVKPPHPVWTNGYGQAITQINMVTLGGMFGLNN